MLDRYKCILGSVGIGFIGTIATIGLLTGHDGVLMAGSMTAISAIVAGLCGYEIGLKNK